ncbi:MAG: hypothetical protein PF689_06580 [Deltaproteobacteria bacterium]|jgi:hypothetical protein|nr:hypothetical protein [Deltaproteobacteria bacterium]
MLKIQNIQKNLVLFFALLTVVALLPSLAGCDETTPTPSGIQASQGTYVGVVHLAWGDITGDAIAERRDPQSGEWFEISWMNGKYFDDQGYLLPEGKIIPGQVYQYRLRAHSNDGSFSKYTDVSEGYAYEVQPVTNITITRNPDYEEQNLISFEDPNNYDQLQNVLDVTYKIYQQKQDYPDEFVEQKTISNSNYYGDLDTVFNDVEVSIWGDLEKTFSYKISIEIKYSIQEQNGSYYESYTEWLDSSVYTEGQNNNNNNNNNNNPLITYNIENLGTVFSTQDSITKLKSVVFDETIYLAALKNVSVTGYGVPAFYNYASGWQPAAGNQLPDPMVNSSDLSQVEVAVDNNYKYLGGLDYNNVHAYQYDGSWSDNLIVDNYGASDSPANMALAAHNNELYVAVTTAPDWDLQVYKQTSEGWETVGGDSNGYLTQGFDVFNLRITKANDNLYLYYTEKLADFEHILHIKKLNGSSWDSVLSWQAQNISNIKLEEYNNEVYFLSGSQALGEYPGGVYKVVSGSSVENLIPEEAQWFIDPQDFTIDSQGNIIVASFKYESAESIYPYLNLYDGTTWKTIDDDFSNTAVPVNLESINNDIYFTCGDKTSVNDFNHPTTIISKKYTP